MAHYLNAKTPFSAHNAAGPLCYPLPPQGTGLGGGAVLAQGASVQIRGCMVRTVQPTLC